MTPAPLPYRLLTGPDDSEFCARVSAALAEGYKLYGSPAITFDGTRVIAAQAVVLAADARTDPVFGADRGSFVVPEDLDLALPPDVLEGFTR